MNLLEKIKSHPFIKLFDGPPHNGKPTDVIIKRQANEDEFVTASNYIQQMILKDLVVSASIISYYNDINEHYHNVVTSIDEKTGMLPTFTVADEETCNKLKKYWEWPMDFYLGDCFGYGYENEIYSTNILVGHPQGYRFNIDGIATSFKGDICLKYYKHLFDAKCFGRLVVNYFE